MARKIWLITCNTFIETMRQPVFCLIVFISGYIIAFSPCFAMFTMLENTQLVQDMGLATMLLSGLALSVFSAFNVVTQEIDRRTALTLLAKPVGRLEFIVGKYLGIAGGLAVAMYLLGIVLVLTVRIGVPEAAYMELDHVALWAVLIAAVLTPVLGAAANYFFDKPFTSSAMLYGLVVFTIAIGVAGFLDEKGKAQAFFANMDSQTVTACLLLLMAVWVLAAAAVAVSTRANFGVTLLVCVTLFMLGLVSDYLFGRHAATSALARVMYAAVPNLQVFWMADALADKKTIPLEYVCRAGGYAGAYALGLVFVAAALFQEREMS